jgi:hypothetical protein
VFVVLSGMLASRDFALSVLRELNGAHLSSKDSCTRPSALEWFDFPGEVVEMSGLR